MEPLLTLLDPDLPDQEFPPVEKALKEPDGLLAAGGCLSPQRIVSAYRHGIFPWYSPGEPILWWSPDPRLVLFPNKFSPSRSLRKTLRRQVFRVTFDTAFDDVISACSAARKDAEGTWITPEMQQAYRQLHQLGFAHSVEAWCNEELAGGLYGVVIGHVFFGESMFHRQRDASKVAFAHLVQALLHWRYQLIDCQVRTPHLFSLGAEEISREHFLRLLGKCCQSPASEKAWQHR